MGRMSKDKSEDIYLKVFIIGLVVMLMGKRLILVILLSLFFLFGFSISYKVINFSQYKYYLSVLNKSNLSKVDFSKLSLSSGNCFYFSSGDFFYLAPSCLYYKNFPKLSIEEFANIIFPYIKGFKTVYDLDSTGFFYQTANPQFFVNFDCSGYVGTGKTKLLLNFVLNKLGYFVKIPKIDIAFLNLSNYSFFVAGKNLSKRNKGRLQNFNVAIKATNNLLLKPGEIFNFNKKVAYLPGYYKKNPNSHYAFYAGVCGVSTMFFRNALINPYLYIVKRYNHNHRYVYFYSNYLYGDDAAVYEFDKVLELKNISDKPILFKTKRIGKEIYLVSLIPKNWQGFTYVRKEKIGRLKALVSKTVFDSDGGVWYKQSWVSKYMGYDYSK